MSKITVSTDDHREADESRYNFERQYNFFLTNSLELVNSRSYEADYVKGGAEFLRGYTMAIQDIGNRLYNRNELESLLQEDEDTEDWTGVPF